MIMTKLSKSVNKRLWDAHCVFSVSKRAHSMDCEQPSITSSYPRHIYLARLFQSPN